MKEISRTSMAEVYETDKGNIVSIVEDDCRGFKKYYSVVVRFGGTGRGKTIKTRCLYETAYAIAETY